jgi:hypothetical protein
MRAYVRAYSLSSYQMIGRRTPQEGGPSESHARDSPQGAYQESLIRKGVEYGIARGELAITYLQRELSGCE